jgi:hypothetical protein
VNVDGALQRRDLQDVVNCLRRARRLGVGALIQTTGQALRFFDLRQCLLDSFEAILRTP